jgi:hypothetical protein
MIHIRYIYNRSKKAAANNPAEMTFASMERDIRRLFPLGDRPLFFFYHDEAKCRILILDDDDIRDVVRLAAAQLTPFKIHLNSKERLIQESGNNEFLQRMFVRECLRHHTRGFAKRRLISDLQTIRDCLLRASVKPNIVKRLLRGISQDVQMHFVDATFDGLKPHDIENACRSEGEGATEAAPSFSSIVDQTATHSFMSRGDFSLFSEPIFSVARSEPPDSFLRSPISADDKEGRQTCSKCKTNVSAEIRFHCDRCPKLLLCEECCNSSRHKHELKPVFIINDSKQKINALSKVFRRLKYNRIELFFSLLKEGFFKPRP